MDMNTKCCASEVQKRGNVEATIVELGTLVKNNEKLAREIVYRLFPGTPGQEDKLATPSPEQNINYALQELLMISQETQSVLKFFSCRLDDELGNLRFE